MFGMFCPPPKSVSQIPHFSLPFSWLQLLVITLTVGWLSCWLLWTNMAALCSLFHQHYRISDRKYSAGWIILSCAWPRCSSEQDHSVITERKNPHKNILQNCHGNEDCGGGGGGGGAMRHQNVVSFSALSAEPQDFCALTLNKNIQKEFDLEGKPFFLTDGAGGQVNAWLNVLLCIRGVFMCVSIQYFQIYLTQRKI